MAAKIKRDDTVQVNSMDNCNPLTQLNSSLLQNSSSHLGRKGRHEEVPLHQPLVRGRVLMDHVPPVLLAPPRRRAVHARAAKEEQHITFSTRNMSKIF